ncbi:hypothetical protein PENSPDRAFT_236174 [Peniophora sp. CONT]|nr:hypothetical protein PENSPDRAFT_236174 [Peniophora sp. CONT]
MPQPSGPLRILIPLRHAAGAEVYSFGHKPPPRCLRAIDPSVPRIALSTGMKAPKLRYAAFSPTRGCLESPCDPLRCSFVLQTGSRVPRYLPTPIASSTLRLQRAQLVLLSFVVDPSLSTAAARQQAHFPATNARKLLHYGGAFSSLGLSATRHGICASLLIKIAILDRPSNRSARCLLKR